MSIPYCRVCKQINPKYTMNFRCESCQSSIWYLNKEQIEKELNGNDDKGVCEPMQDTGK